MSDIKEKIKQVILTIDAVHPDWDERKVTQILAILKANRWVELDEQILPDCRNFPESYITGIGLQIIGYTQQDMIQHNWKKVKE